VPLANITKWTAAAAIKDANNKAVNTAAHSGASSGAGTGAGPGAALNISGGALFLATVGFRPGKGSRGLDWDGGCW